MKLSKIIEKIDKSKNNEEEVYLYEIAETEFSLNIRYEEQKRLKSYWIQRWYCSGSYLGLKLYFLDDKAVMFSKQYGRKNDEEYYWIKEEYALDVKKYCIEFLIEEECNDYISICNLDEDIGEFYTLDYAHEIIDKDKMYLNDEHVEFIRTVRIKDELYIHDEIEIKLPNGEIKQVEMSKLRFKYNLKEND